MKSLKRLEKEIPLLKRALFKIGDKVKLTGTDGKYFMTDDWSNFVKIGEILTISNIELFGKELCYGFKEDIAEKGKAHWLNVEKNFTLVK